MKVMKTTDIITSKLNRFPQGYVFTYEDFHLEVERKEAVIKALNRMVASGKIEKLSKGKYYKPEKTPFGDLQPNQEQIVKDLLEDDGKLIGYLTCLSIYNKLGLTTQVSNTIQIGKNVTAPAFKRNRYNISFIKQKNTITKDNIPMFQVLDAIRFIKKIPDSTIEQSLKRLIAIIEEVPALDLYTIVRLALKYPPATRALLGAILEDLGHIGFILGLYKSLNPITKYKIKGADKILPNTQNWNII